MHECDSNKHIKHVILIHITWLFIGFNYNSHIEYVQGIITVIVVFIHFNIIWHWYKCDRLAQKNFIVLIYWALRMCNWWQRLQNAQSVELLDQLNWLMSLSLIFPSDEFQLRARSTFSSRWDNSSIRNKTLASVWDFLS